MPIYEYQCKNCDHHVEKVQKITDPALKHCESCGHESLEKLMSLSSFSLKGSGWYTTDYKKKSTQTSQEKSPESKQDSEGASAQKKDASSQDSASKGSASKASPSSSTSKTPGKTPASPTTPAS